MSTTITEQPKQNQKSVLATMANRYGMEPRAFETTVKATLGLDKCNDGQFAAFLCVANEYGLNPLTKEIYAFPTKSGGIQPIVGIDGWLNLANSHPMFDGMEFEDVLDQQGCLAAITCRIHRKDRRHSICVTEYMGECRGNTGPWKQWPARMLRHKATIQAIRYAFGFAGVMDPDEYERMMTVDSQVSKAVKNEPIRITQIPVSDSAHKQTDSEQFREVEEDPYAKAAAEREVRLASESLASSPQDA